MTEVLIKTYSGYDKGKDAMDRIIDFWYNETKINYLSLFTLSLDNYKKRPELEKNHIYKILSEGLYQIIERSKDIRINFIGNWQIVNNNRLIEAINYSLSKTKNNQGKMLNFIFCYDFQEEIVQAFKKIYKANIDVDKIDENVIKQFLYTKDLPNVDLLIRTGGEQRVSGFLSWDIVYAELYFLEKFFPEFTISDFRNAVEDFYKRERRYGK